MRVEFVVHASAWGFGGGFAAVSVGNGPDSPTGRARGGLGKANMAAETTNFSNFHE